MGIFARARTCTEHAGFDYAEVESAANVFYEHYTQEALEELLLLTAQRAILLEAWGSPYFRDRSRTASDPFAASQLCRSRGHPESRRGLCDFIFPITSVLCLFKFCGQP